ncbi:MAG: hypothetical protein J7641_13070 [Cyanobacteria bacterium SID2]|nr:hypothetical protein [Cyanobacteria bacterium SID2]MBP0004941.1 hypothetical protein [Cyanobacteria bacterium SBC]
MPRFPVIGERVTSGRVETAPIGWKSTMTFTRTDSLKRTCDISLANQAKIPRNAL